MIKTIMLKDGYFHCDPRLHTEINKFIEEHKVKVIDIKFAATGKDNTPTALVIYEEDENV